MTAGVQVTLGDFNNDGVDDIITAPGEGGAPHVRIFDGVTGVEIPTDLGNFFAGDPAAREGADITTTDFTGDGLDDLFVIVPTEAGVSYKLFNGATGQSEDAAVGRILTESGDAILAIQALTPASDTAHENADNPSQHMIYIYDPYVIPQQPVWDERIREMTPEERANAVANWASGTAEHHPYPLYLGGRDDVRIELTPDEHRKIHESLKRQGYGGAPKTNGTSGLEFDTARAKWAALTDAQRRQVIIQSLRDAGIPDEVISKHIDKIVESAKPGVNNGGIRNSSPKKVRTIVTRKEISAAAEKIAKVARLATALGGILIFGTVGYANDVYVETGEQAGMKGVNKIGLMTELGIQDGLDQGLPREPFYMVFRDALIRVRYEFDPQTRTWYTCADRVTVENGRITEIEPILKVGDLPTSLKIPDALRIIVNP